MAVACDEMLPGVSVTDATRVNNTPGKSTSASDSTAIEAINHTPRTHLTFRLFGVSRPALNFAPAPRNRLAGVWGAPPDICAWAKILFENGRLSKKMGIFVAKLADAKI